MRTDCRPMITSLLDHDGKEGRRTTWITEAVKKIIVCMGKKEGRDETLRSSFREIVSILSRALVHRDALGLRERDGGKS